MGGLDGKVAVVAGASRGIGRGIALEVGAEGATVYVTGRTAPALTDLAAEIDAAGGTGIVAVCDHAVDDDVAALFGRVRAEHGHLDLLVNSVFNSSAFRATIGKPFWELPVTAWDDVVGLGTRSAYVATACAAPLLLAARRGVVVNISARGADRYRYNVVYGVGKAALDRLTRDAAHDLRPRGVAVVSLWPGAIRTEHMDAMLAAGDQWARENFPDPDALETPRYVGRTVAALAADTNVMERTGQRFWVAEVAADYGVTDEHGRPHERPE